MTALIMSEEAKAVRKHTLDMLAEIRRPLIFPSSLRYAVGASDITKRHAARFQSILASGRDKRMSEDIHDVFHPNPNVDIVFRMEGENPVYYYAGNVLKSTEAELGENFFVNVHIMQNAGRNGMWDCQFVALPHGDETDPLGLGPSNLKPEHSMLLHFMFTPEVLDGPELLVRMGGSQNSKDHTRFLTTDIRNGYTHFDFAWDGLKYADVEANIPYIPGIAERNSTFLRNRGDFIFSVIEVGVVDIAGKKHGVYTGSERIVSLA